MPDLTPTDIKLLDAWSLSWSFPGARDSMLVDATGLTPAQQAWRLNRLIDMEEAMAAYPILCRHLRQVRDRLQRSRRIGA